MKYLVLFAVVCYVYAGSIEESKKLIQNENKIFKKCMVDGNITESDVAVIFTKYELPETRAMKCVMGCYMKGMGYLTDDGKLYWNKLDEVNKIEYLDPAQLKKALEATSVCNKSVPQNLGNICDAGYAAAKCFLEEAKKSGLHIFGLETA
nr:odorant-binding protein 10 [Plautia stali]